VLQLLQIFTSMILCLSATSINTSIVIDDITANSTGHKSMSTTHKLFQMIVTGTISPYHTVVIVTNPHQSDCGIDENSGFELASL